MLRPPLLAACTSSNAAVNQSVQTVMKIPKPPKAPTRKQFRVLVKKQEAFTKTLIIEQIAKVMAAQSKLGCETARLEILVSTLEDKR